MRKHREALRTHVEQDRKKKKQKAGEKQSKVDFRGEGQWENSGGEAQVWMRLAGQWDTGDNGADSQEESEIDREMERMKENLVNSARKAIDVLQQIEESQGCRRSARIQEKRRKEPSAGPLMMAPLTAVQGHMDRYKPFTVGDTQAIVDKLPR